MAANDRILDQYLANRTFLREFENKVIRDVLRILAEGEERALGRLLADYGDLVDQFIMRGRTVVPWSGPGDRFRVQQLTRLRAVLADVFPKARRSIAEALGGVVDEELATFEEGLRAILPGAFDLVGFARPSERQLALLVSNKIARNRRGSVRALFDEWSQIEEAALQRVDDVIVAGVRDGIGVRDMAREAGRVLSTSEGPFANDVARFVRTKVQASANDAAAAVYRENSDVVKAEQYVATLDSDTCPICGPLDGKVYALGSRGAPRPPRHPLCRCFLSPVVRSWSELGLDGLSDAAKKALDGKPAERVVWSEWIQRKPARLRAALGPTRAAAVRDGRISLTRLATTTRVRTLEEIGLARRAAS